MRNFHNFAFVKLEYIECPICSSGDSTKLSEKGRDYIKTHVSICNDCGFLFQNPRWSKSDMIKFYETRYDSLYRSGMGTKSKDDGFLLDYKFGFGPLWKRINAYTQLNQSSYDISILDVGSGDGENLAFLGRKFKTEQLYAIEPSPGGQKILKKRGITLIDKDVDGEWTKEYESHFDLVVLRHVFEHLNDCNDFLTRVRTVLKPGGLLYLAVPDAYNSGPELYNREFFRIVHNWYFTETSLSNILRKNGFNIVKLKDGDKHHSYELFVFASYQGDPSEINIDKNEVERFLNYISPKLRKESTIFGEIVAFMRYAKRKLYDFKVFIKKMLKFH